MAEDCQSLELDFQRQKAIWKRQAWARKRRSRAYLAFQRFDVFEIKARIGESICVVLQRPLP